MLHTKNLSLVLVILLSLCHESVLAVSKGAGTFSIERFRPTMDRGGIIDVDWADTRYKGQFDFALTLGYQNNPLNIAVRENDVFVRASSLVRHRVTTYLTSSYTFSKRLQLGVALPIVVYQDRQLDTVFRGINAETTLGAGGLGDLRLSPKIKLADQSQFGLMVAVTPHVTIPTSIGFDDSRIPAKEQYLGEAASWGADGTTSPYLAFTFMPELLLSRLMGSWRWAGNLGLKIRPRTEIADLEVGHEFQYRTGVAYRFPWQKPLEIGTSVGGTVGAFNPSDTNLFDELNETQLEWLSQLTYDITERTQILAGGGLGLLEGYGTPDFRVFVGFRYSPNAHDRDGDGYEDKIDACPDDPEDFDGYEDEDGCPEPDNDGDGILDVDDRCPLVPGVVENQGCPLDLDADGDGVFDDVDECPNTPGSLRAKGCPDSDKDGLPDNVDKCPYEPEIINGVDDDDGCPDEGKPKARLTPGSIEILEKVFFDVDKAVIKARSYDLLNQVAAIMKTNQQITLLRIGGHTDSTASEVYNKALSDRRAKAVRTYLIEHGVQASRLVGEGFGELQPIATNDTDEGRAKNRRVEFVVEEINGRRAME